MGIQIQRVPAATGGSYSDVVDISGPGRWIMVSGQVAFGPDGTVRGSMEEQAHGCFDHIERALAKVGGSLSHVVRITSFTTTLEDYAGFSTARAARFGAFPPASATVQVAGLLAGAQIEIDAVAFIPA
jgi:2-iminobutanoate/2-iminopropanoate deaminase